MTSPPPPPPAPESRQAGKPSVVRSFMLWMFDVPHGEPYVMTTVDIRWDRALAWIEAQNAGPGPRITTQHVFTSAVGRLFREFPVINARNQDAWSGVGFAGATSSPTPGSTAGSMPH